MNPPAGAVKATAASFAELSNGRPANVVVYDADAPIIARLVWDWKKKRITGDYIHDGKNRGKVKRTISFADGKACSVGKGEKQPTCYSVMIDQNIFYELTDARKVHAVSVVE